MVSTINSLGYSLSPSGFFYLYNDIKLKIYIFKIIDIIQHISHNHLYFLIKKHTIKKLCVFFMIIILQIYYLLKKSFNILSSTVLLG